MIRTLLLLLTLFIMQPASARDMSFSNNDGIFLIRSCIEATEVFKKRDEMSFLAAQRTSLAESLMAGYCIGYVQQYLSHSDCEANKNDWFFYVTKVATLSLPKDVIFEMTPDQTLNTVVCGS